jgi:L-threonylcarbamoyladenylate synthase
MSVYANDFNETVVRLLKDGGIGVIRTDTIYGIVAKADNEAAVERVYNVKTRTPSKSPVVLISSVEQLFDRYDQEIVDRSYKLWPGKVSVILPSTSAPYWIRRENESVAYRLPDDEKLRQLIEKTGPLAAPSANPEGLPTAMSIDEAKAYFGDQVDFYVDGGTVTDATPSRLYRMHANGWERLR